MKTKSHLEQMVEWERIFDKSASMPKSPLDCRKWFIKLYGDKSPENLCCDGEASSSQIKQKLKSINESWKELEKLYGQKVSEETVEDWMMESYA